MYKQMIAREFAMRPQGERLNRQILDYIINNNSAMTYMGAEKFCYECDCTDYQLEEFICMAGFRDYSEMKEFVGRIINSADTETEYDSSMENMVEQVVENLVSIEMGNMLDFKQNVDRKNILRLVQDIISAPEVVLLGTRASEPIMSYGVYILNKIGIRATKLDSANTNYYDQVNNIDRSAMVIALGFARYPKATIVAASNLKRKGFKIASITDFVRSPLVNLSEYSIIVRASSREFTDSYVSAMLLLNLIVVIIQKCNGEYVEKKLKEYDENAFSMDYYI